MMQPMPTRNANIAVQLLNTDNDAQLIAHANKILKAVAGNFHRTPPMPQLAAVTDAMSTLVTAMADAGEGNTTMNAVKNAARKLLVKGLRQLADYVQVTSQGEMIFLSPRDFSIENQTCQLMDALRASANSTATTGYRRSEYRAGEMTVLSAH